MKKSVSAAAGVILTGIMLLLGIVLPNYGEKTYTVNEQVMVGNEGGCPVKATGSEGIKPGGYIDADVTRIVDGDTVIAEYKGEEYRVRLLCIDTPETVMKGIEKQPYGEEAAKKLKKLALGKKTRLIFEKDVRDRYERLLAYVISDKTCVNALMVSEGLARVETVSPNVLYKDYFCGLQEKAVSNKKGIWSLPEDERPFIKDDYGNYIPRFEKEEAA